LHCVELQLPFQYHTTHQAESFIAKDISISVKKKKQIQVIKATDVLFHKNYFLSEGNQI
jgi:hypothetical protein